MSTKDKLLELFENNKGTYFSGEEIAEKLGISRAAVWKAVNGIRSAGYPVEAVTNKGYCLLDEADLLSAAGIEKYLDEDCKKKLTVSVEQVVDSTNTMLVKQAGQGVAEGCVLVAGQQTAGKGRVGRTFFSPKDTGLYISLLLRPSQIPASQAVRITTMAAVAMCEAIKEVTGQTAGIKWVNDVFFDGKKICGILTEGGLSMETGCLDYAVLGVGINVYEPEGGFPEEIKDIAGALLKDRKSDVRNHLAASLLNHFYSYYGNLNDNSYAKKYKDSSLALGKEVNVLNGQIQRKAFVIDIDEECHLLVRYEDGTEEALSNGEISIKL